MTDTPVDDFLRAVTSGALVTELMNRGVLRAYGITDYIPGVVIQRSAAGAQEIINYSIARSTHNLAKSMVNDGVIAAGTSLARDRDPDAAPNDTIVEVQLLTLDPKANMSATGMPPSEELN